MSRRLLRPSPHIPPIRARWGKERINTKDDGAALWTTWQYEKHVMYVPLSRSILCRFRTTAWSKPAWSSELSTAIGKWMYADL